MSQTLIVAAGAGAQFEDGEDRGRILVSGADTGGRYALMELTVAPQAPEAGFGPHLHRQMEETFLVRRGNLEFLLGDAVIALIEGDFVRAPPGTRHGYRNVSGADVELLVSFYPGGFEQLFLKYRTDGGDPSAGTGFVEEATQHHASEFEP
jgi:quercetin dioxygenase-like cupin family protein